MNICAIPNASFVSPGVFRSGQPVTPGDWAYIISLGIKVVIKLNFDDEGPDEPAVHAGLTVIRCSMHPRHFWDSVGKTDPDAIGRAVQALGDESQGPRLVHCTHGQDRTGLIVGMHRVKRESWRPEDAYQEMLMRGFHPELHGLHEAWEAFAGVR